MNSKDILKKAGSLSAAAAALLLAVPANAAINSSVVNPTKTVSVIYHSVNQPAGKLVLRPAAPKLQFADHASHSSHSSHSSHFSHQSGS